MLPEKIILADLSIRLVHAWAQAFVDRGMAALTLDGPGQGETSFHLPTTSEWGPVLGTVIDVLERRADVDGSRLGIVGQSLGAIYAPLAAAGEPRIKACIANCGPYDWGQVLPKMPPISQEVFRVRSHAKTMDEAYALAKKITLDGAAERITCPLLVIWRRRSPDCAFRRRAPCQGSKGPFGNGDLRGRQSRLFQHQLQISAADG